LKNYFIKILITIISIGFVTLVATNCGDNIMTNREITFPDSNVSYQNHVQPFLNIKCAYRGCHSAEDMKDGRNMTDYFNLFSTANLGLILPGKPEESRIIQIMRGNPMHRGTFEFPAGYFSQNNINGMVVWIKEGAKFN
jgi:hypothetical protein